MKFKSQMLGLALAAAALVGGAASGAQAGTFVVGSNADGANCFPFGCNLGNTSTVYQQVYAASDFPGSMSITGLTFYNSVFPSTPLNSGTYTISLSTTSAAVDGLDTTTFSNNIGGDNVVLFTGSLPSLVAGGSFTLPFTGAFHYNPGNGNLLLNIDVSGASGGSAYLNALNGDAGGLFSRAHNFGSAFSDWGLETGFVTGGGGVPEPATWGLMLVGFGGLGLALRRSRRSVAAAA